MPQQLVYGEDHPGVTWQMVTIVIASWVAVIVGITAIALPHLAGLGVPLFIVGGFFALVYTCFLWYARDTGFRVYEDGIQIGGLRNRDRRLRRGTWPPRKKLSAISRKAVFTCPWQAADGLYLLTAPQDIKRIRQDARAFRKRTKGTEIALGVLDSAAYFAGAFLVISNNPGLTASEPREFRAARGQSGPVWPVPSPTWLVPVRNPAALQAAVAQLPQAPPLYDRLPAGHVRFEASQ